MKPLFKWIISIVAPVAVGGISSYFTASSVKTWFTTINKPAFNPPSWLFAPVWTVLYILMGVALALVWTNPNASRIQIKNAIGIFTLQLILNFFWSVIFFGKQEPGWAFIEIIFLWICILATIISFSKISKTAVWLLVPYIAWVSFAAILNYSIWQLN